MALGSGGGGSRVGGGEKGGVLLWVISGKGGWGRRAGAGGVVAELPGSLFNSQDTCLWP